MKSIAICSSLAFYKDVVTIKNLLQEKGFAVRIPTTAQKMEDNDQYDPAAYKNQLKSNGEVKTKSDFIREMFDVIPQVDSVLIINNEKNSLKNYIGANVFLEMGIAFYHKKQIFLLNSIPDQSAFKDELLGMNIIALEGDLEKLV